MTSRPGGTSSREHYRDNLVTGGGTANDIDESDPDWEPAVGKLTRASMHSVSTSSLGSPEAVAGPNGDLRFAVTLPLRAVLGGRGPCRSSGGSERHPSGGPSPRPGVLEPLEPPFDSRKDAVEYL
jgi:hypothetical protein